MRTDPVETVNRLCELYMNKKTTAQEQLPFHSYSVHKSGI